MDAKEFNDTFLQNTLEKLSYENKDIILMSYFNIDILKYDTNNDSAEFLDMMYENNPRKHYNHHFRPLCTVYTLQKQNKITKK